METGAGENAEVTTTEAAPEAIETDTSAETTTPAETPNETDSKTESVRETAERAFKELSEKEEPTDGNEDKSPEASLVAKDPKTGKFVNKAKAQKVQAANDAFLAPPPERFSAEAKQTYSQLPPVLKKELHKTVKDLEAMATRATQRTAQIEEAIAPYVDDFAELKHSPAEAIRALCAAQRKLTNPKTSLAAYTKLGQELGIDFSQLNPSAAPSKQPVTDISSHPEFKGLRDQLNSLQSFVNERKQNEAAQPIVAQMKVVRDETDANGQFSFPELQDGEFLETVKPLVAALVRAVPGTGYGEALRHATLGIRRDSSSLDNAYRAALASMFSGAPSNTQAPSLPQANKDTSIQQRALGAAVSVRGRTNNITNPGISRTAKEIPNDMRATVEMALRDIEQGIRS